MVDRIICEDPFMLVYCPDIIQTSKYKSLKVSMGTAMKIQNC